MGNVVNCMHLENDQVLLRTRDCAWVADGTKDEGGDGLGPGPFEILLAALGSCLSMTVYNLAASSAIPLERLWVDLRDGWDRLDDQERYHVRVTLRVRGDLSEQDLERLRRYAERCPIYHMLSQVAVIEKEIERV